MATLTIRIPDDKYSRLKALTEFDAETRFRALAASGDIERGLEILDELDAHFPG